MSEDYYKILSVEPTASQKEIQEAAERLTSIWNQKRGLSYNKRSEILSQIRKARAVLTDPLQRFEYDIEHGFKRDFTGQALMKKREFIPLHVSESIEALDTVKISGQLDYGKLEMPMAAIEIVTQVKEKPDMKPYSKSESAINYTKDQPPFNRKNEVVEFTRKLESVESSQFPSDAKKSFDSSNNRDFNLKQYDLDCSKLQKFRGIDIPQNVETGKNASDKSVWETKSKEIFTKKFSKELSYIMKEKNCKVVPSEEVIKVTRLEEELKNENSEIDFTVDSKCISGEQNIENKLIRVLKKTQTLPKGREFLKNRSEMKLVNPVVLTRKSLLERKTDPTISSSLENETLGQQKYKTSVKLTDEISLIPADSEDNINIVYKSCLCNEQSPNFKQDITRDCMRDTEILPNDNKSLENVDKIEHVNSYEIIQQQFSRRKTHPNIRSFSENENNSNRKSSFLTREEISKSVPGKRKRSITLNNEVTIIPPKIEVKSDESMPRISLEKKSSDLKLDFESRETGTSYLLPEELDTIIKHVDSLLIPKNRNSRRNTEPDIGSTFEDKFNDQRLSLSCADKERDNSVRTSDDIPITPSEEEVLSDISDKTLKRTSSYSNLNQLLISEKERDSKDSPKTARAMNSEEVESLTEDSKHNSPAVNFTNNHNDKENSKMSSSPFKSSRHNSLAANSKNNPNDKENSKMSSNLSKYSRHNSPATNSKNNSNHKENSKMSQNSSEDFRHNSPAANSKNNPNDKENSKTSSNPFKDSRHNSPATNSENNPNVKENSKTSPKPFQEESDRRTTPQNQLTSDKNPVVSSDIDKQNKGKKIMMKGRSNALYMSSNKENSSQSVQSVSATTRTSGTDIKTVYTFGSDTDLIEVLVNGELKVKINKGEKQDVYCNEIKHDDLPPVGNICASTVIAANSCIITTEVTRRGKKESISVYKNDTLLCRTGSSIILAE